ncbi:phenazine antibiotic biosynthesis protein [Streptomyces guryensis]|uniref:Phenazine antibiotic biosynthesis protein n=1 Tax=Streptomyces guryensis TaxID=2886947 RepID=A0A9Q3VT61_9ACTN|nr:phenazine antibiotic biosynthesis protein [Streptomyces guryensis]MCD9877337.1 phenazine antibiotic biosynthesis protein [Streptomyces guryensis]
MNSREQADAHVRAMMRWHFDPATGSRYWLERRDRLGFDPVEDVRCVDDLLRFPNLVDELRDVPVEDLIPRGLDPTEEVTAVYESGGTTGAPKRFVMFESWFDRYMAWEDSHHPDDGTGHTLAVAPSGPHMLGEYSRRIARARGGIRFSIDLDPRWVKRLMAAGDTAAAGAYVDHLVDQAELILRSQDIAFLITTPPLLARLAERAEVRALIQEKVRLVIWTGAHMDADTLDYLSTEFFPKARFRGSYGSTSVLSGTVQRPDPEGTGDVVFDSYAPFVLYRVVDPSSGRPVEFGSEGAVVMNHLTEYGLVPNSLERDLAVRVPSPTGVGDSLRNVRPLAEADGRKLVEGVY